MMVIMVPPAIGPAAGVIPVTVGVVSYAKWSAGLVADVPPGVVTVMSTTPADSAGDVAVHEVLEEQLTEVPALPPKATVLEPTTKPVPVIVTTVPAESGPKSGLMAPTVGARSKVNWSAELVEEVPPAFVAVMSTVPADSAGDVAVHDVVDEQLTEVPAEEPKAIVVAPTMNPVPVMVTAVPPPIGPAAGLTAVMIGGSVKLWLVVAEAAPLSKTSCPVKTWVLEVPAVSVTVKEAVNGPAVA